MADLPQQRERRRATVAQSATASRRLPPRPPAARGKKMTRSASRGTSSNARTSSAWRRPVCGSWSGTAAHIPSSSWRRNASTRRSSSSAHRGVAFGDQLLAMTRAHAQELHKADYARGAVRRIASAASLRPPGRSKTSTGPGARAELPQAVARPPPTATAWARRAASSGSSPSASWAASADECVQPEPCAAPSGWRSPGMLERDSPSKKTSSASSRCPPVTTTACGPERVERRGRAPRRPAPAPVAGQHPRLREVRA